MTRPCYCYFYRCCLYSRCCCRFSFCCSCVCCCTDVLVSIATWTGSDEGRTRMFVNAEMQTQKRARALARTWANARPRAINWHLYIENNGGIALFVFCRCANDDGKGENSSCYMQLQDPLKRFNLLLHVECTGHSTMTCRTKKSYEPFWYSQFACTSAPIAK